LSIFIIFIFKQKEMNFSGLSILFVNAAYLAG